MGRILQIDEDRVKELAKKCPDWKKGLSELFPSAFPKQSFVSGQVFLHTPTNKFYQLRHAPMAKTYLLTDLSTGYNILHNPNKYGSEPIYFMRTKNKEIDIPTEELKLIPVPMHKWDELLITMNAIMECIEK